MSTSSDPAARATVTNEAQRRRRIGLALLLAGLALAVGGFFLPWLSVTCVANLRQNRIMAPFPPTRGPARPKASSSSSADPAWGLALVFVLLTAVEEFRPAERHTAVPALLLAGALLVMQAIGLASNVFIGFSTGPQPILTDTLLPGCAVSLLGTLLVAVGGWLHYHPWRATHPASLPRSPRSQPSADGEDTGGIGGDAGGDVGAEASSGPSQSRFGW